MLTLSFPSSGCRVSPNVDALYVMDAQVQGGGERPSLQAGVLEVWGQLYILLAESKNFIFVVILLLLLLVIVQEKASETKPKIKNEQISPYLVAEKLKYFGINWGFIYSIMNEKSIIY